MKGFTLMEIICTFLFVGILFAIAAPSFIAVEAKTQTVAEEDDRYSPVEQPVDTLCERLGSKVISGLKKDGERESYSDVIIYIKNLFWLKLMEDNNCNMTTFAEKALENAP